MLGECWHFLNHFQEGLAGRGEFRTMCHPAKQGRAEFCFEVLDLLAERRLADPNLVCLPQCCDFIR
jgi:hypothetical protein